MTSLLLRLKMNIPSVNNPPNAPKKKKISWRSRRGLENIPKLVFPEEPQTKPYWRVLAESGFVRQKYLRYTPEDVAEIDCIDMLDTLREWYFPASQPHNDFEADYLQLVLDAVNNRLYML